MICRILKSSHGHPLTRSLGSIQGIACQTCSMGKLITMPSYNKICSNPPIFLQRIQGDICGPIQPPCGPFRYFMVLVDASTHWSHVCLLSTSNVVFSKLLATSGFSFGSVMRRTKLCVTKLVLSHKASHNAPGLTMTKLIHPLWMWLLFATLSVW